MPADWFAQNAPQQSGGDWFASNAPQGSSGGIHPLDSLGRGISAFWDKVNPVSAVQGLSNAVTHPSDTAHALGQQNLDIWNKAKSAYDAGNYPGALLHGVNYVLNGIPGLGASIEDATDKLQSGDIAGGIGSSLGIGANLAAPVVAPKVASAVGSGLQRAAEPLAESALGIRAIDRAYGKTPGRAALDETRGIRPETVAASARDRLADLDSQLDTATANAGARGATASLKAARDLIAKRKALAQAGNSAATAADLGEMEAQLTEPRPGFAGTVAPKPPPLGTHGPAGPMQIAEDQPPNVALRMKREFNNDFVKWNPLHANRDAAVARGVYHELDRAGDVAVPESASLNQRTSSLIPVAQGAERADLRAGATQNLLHKAAVHTGAGAAAAIVGMNAGPQAGLATFAVPEILAMPATRMAAARTVNAAGKVAGSPFGQSAATAGAALNNVRLKKDPFGLSEFLDDQQ